MATLNRLLIALDVYHDYRDDPTHQPLEIRKALRAMGDTQKPAIHLVGCGFEEFLHDAYSNFGPEAIEQRKQFVGEMEQRLQTFAESLTARGLVVDCRVHWTYPRYEQISKEAIDLDVDLVVQHANMRQPFERHNLSHDSWQLVKTCPKPLLLTKDREWPEQPVILAAVDPVHKHHKPMALDFNILDQALHLQQRMGGVVHVVHACAESARPFTDPEAIRQTHRDALDELLSHYQIAEDAIHMVDDTPVNALMRCQDSLQADVVVIGALSRSRLADSIIGNTANRVLDYVPADLLIVRPDKG